MASACIDEKDIRKYLEHIHPNLLSDAESYEVGVYYIYFLLITIVDIEIETELERK